MLYDYEVTEFSYQAKDYATRMKERKAHLKQYGLEGWKLVDTHLSQDGETWTFFWIKKSETTFTRSNRSRPSE